MRNRDPKKKQKGQETTIGKIIYGFLLFLPLLAIGVTCLTTLWNKTIDMPNQEVVEIPPYETNEVNSIDDLVIGRIYNFTIRTHYTNATINYFNCKKAYNVENNGKKINLDLSPTSSYMTFQEVSNYFGFQSNGANTFFITDYGSKVQVIETTFQFVYSGSFNNNYISQVSKATWIPSSSYEIIENESTDLNVFYYSIDKVQQSPLFNWAENSIIYTTTASTCTALSITTPFIPLLMSYWLIISVIYFLYDIALMLVWIIHRKMHELQESI